MGYWVNMLVTRIQILFNLPQEYIDTYSYPYIGREKH